MHASELAHLRRTIAETAREYGLAPIAASTHPFADKSTLETTPKARYQALARDFAGIGRRLAICGMHVHVGIEDDELRIDLMNQARYFLPHLLMLSTSSPFWQGEDTGLKSYRLAVFHELPRTGLPQRFESFGEFQRTVDVLVQNGVIEDATKIWWDLRPSARFPTLEMRVTDVCTRIDDALSIAALFVCITRMLYRLRRSNQKWRSYPAFLIEENRWRAQRYGVHGGALRLRQGQARAVRLAHRRAIGSHRRGCRRARLREGGQARAQDRDGRHQRRPPGAALRAVDRQGRERLRKR